MYGHGSDDPAPHCTPTRPAQPWPGPYPDGVRKFACWHGTKLLTSTSTIDTSIDIDKLIDSS